MIERTFVQQKLKEYRIQEFMSKKLARTGYSHTEIHRTPLGEKIVVFTTRPGLVVGKKGEHIKELTQKLRGKFKLENPQIEIGDVANPLLDVGYVADKIAYNIERFGSKRFKSIGYRILQDVINAGAIGAEVVISGKLPSARARRWRFSAGYLKKSGDISMSFVKRATLNVDLKSGTIGVKVSLMTPDIVLPDRMVKMKGDGKSSAVIMSSAVVPPSVVETKETKEKITETEKKPAKKAKEKGQAKEKNIEKPEEKNTTTGEAA